MSARRGLPTTKKMRHSAHYVDNLVTERDGGVVGRHLPLSQISPNPDQPRKDMGDLESLTLSIKEQGVLEPLLVNKEGREYRIISGERRYHASTAAGLEMVPCIIKNLDENQILEIALVENLQRKDLHPFEEADGLQVLLKKFNYTHDHIARRIGKSRSSVTEILTLATLAPEVREAAMEADITAKTMLLGVARLDTLEEQLAMIERIANGASREEVRRVAKKQSKPKPFVFKYRSPGKTFNFSLKFKKSEVEADEMIEALEQVLSDLKAQARGGE
ncbi:ParB/RepB/Spo0J family partition protein [Sulfidibacter corallicola]|uniref:ParB/RepB/Spo0J family partition protein n=1 Tax=Sulfidibacter corallicola TaxID=2818388 RepID=A0A8A4TJB8_SULCO|nr:ParB/RepB/Spo0J family partition protein [Sulfidibacter corallicola]QTD49252.1 ParB/RepB/Spo0J family partition protein [Sulfidibacter corallicola]